METPPEHRTTSSVSRWNLPNLISSLRLLGTFILPFVAAWQPAWVFLGLFLLLASTDWIDGRLARAWNQQSAVGARLDSLADSTLLIGTLLGIFVMRSEQLRAEWGWIGLILLSYFVSVAGCLLKYGHWPSYHTRLAKNTWWLGVFGVVCLVLDWTIWPFRLAALSATCANIEATLITLVTDSATTDVRSLFHVLAARRQAVAQGSGIPSGTPPPSNPGKSRLSSESGETSPPDTAPD